MAKTFYSGIREGLFERRHSDRIGMAVWLFGWLVSRQTGERDGLGFVLYDQVLPLEEIARRTGWPLRTIGRWRMILERERYIVTNRGPAGLRWYILNAKKFHNPSTGSAKSGISDMPKVARPIGQKWHTDMPLFVAEPEANA